MSGRRGLLPISGREIPKEPAWQLEPSFLLEAGAKSLKTETTYRSGLRLFADWIQYYQRNDYAKDDPWPLSPDSLSTAVILSYRGWLLANRSQATTNTYMASVLGYLNFLDGMDKLPTEVQLGKLQRQLARRPADRNLAESVIDLDIARQGIPKIVEYYNQLPMPPENDEHNRRLTLLRNRALVGVLYSTAARLSEIVSLNRGNVDHGRTPYAIITGKGGRPRTIHIREYARQAIQSYLRERTDTNPALFVAHSRNAKNARLSSTSAHNTVKHAVKALGLHESISAHDFRHFRATQLLREGMPLEVVQEYLGHKDISTTRGIYAPVLGVQVVGEWLDNVDMTPKDAAAIAPSSNESSKI